MDQTAKSATKSATKHSKKRDEILNLLKSTTSHPSAEWIYSTAKQTIPDLSLATVYRNLAFFCEQGEAVRIATVNGQERYDANTASHTHFICDCCGRILDIHEFEFSAPSLKAIEESYGIEISGQTLSLSGRCEKCSQHMNRS